MSKADIVKQVMRSICTNVNGILELPSTFCEKLTWCTDALVDGVEYPAAKLIALPGKKREKKIFYGERNGEHPKNRIFLDQGLIFQGNIGGQLRTRLYLSSQWGFNGNPNDVDMVSWIAVIRECEKTAQRTYLTQQQEKELMTPDKQQIPAAPPDGQHAIPQPGGNKNPPINQFAGADGDVMGPRNLIMFGAPGTGKSYQLNKQTQREFEDVDGDGNVRHKRYERVTFYPTYSYAQFVGTYKPVMKPKANGAPGEEIAYEFVPGPFLRVLVNTLNEEPDAAGKKKDWCLVIEEINRANAAAVFGDVFQLLDRKNGVSEYPVAASEDVKKYLLKEVKTDAGKKFLEMARRKDSLGNETEEWDCILRIPDNMYIWATMNSADQGVFPMDTAFKRRWEFEYIGIDDAAKPGSKCLNWTIEGKPYGWNDLRRYINGLLIEHDVNEDKLIGPYFVQADGNNVISKKSFASKVLMYLWEDAGRMIRRNLFGNQIKTYSQLVMEWERNEGGVKVFAQCNKKETLPPELKNLYVQWTMPPAGQDA